MLSGGGGALSSPSGIGSALQRRSDGNVTLLTQWAVEKVAVYGEFLAETCCFLVCSRSASNLYYVGEP